MRPIIVGLWLLAAVPARAETRIAVVHSGELLTSESKGLAEIEKRLAKKKTAVKLVQAAGAEASAARALVEGKPATLPEEWKAAQTVLVLEVLPPGGQKPKRLSRGVGSIAIVRPPALEPIYAERVSGESEGSLSSEAFSEWLARLLLRVAQP
jgi:hypothetical protein